MMGLRLAEGADLDAVPGAGRAATVGPTLRWPCRGLGLVTREGGSPARHPRGPAGARTACLRRCWPERLNRRTCWPPVAESRLHSRSSSSSERIADRQPAAAVPACARSAPASSVADRSPSSAACRRPSPARLRAACAPSLRRLARRQPASRPRAPKGPWRRLRRQFRRRSAAPISAPRMAGGQLALCAAAPAHLAAASAGASCWRMAAALAQRVGQLVPGVWPKRSISVR